MRVHFGHQPSIFRTKIGAPYLRPAQEESLVGRKSIQSRRPLAFDLLFKSRIGNCPPSESRVAYAQVQFAISVDTGLVFVAIELPFPSLRPVSEPLAAMLGPPI